MITRISNQGLYLDDKRAPLFKLFISALFGELLQSLTIMYLVVKLVSVMENGKQYSKIILNFHDILSHYFTLLYYRVCQKNFHLLLLLQVARKSFFGDTLWLWLLGHGDPYHCTLLFFILKKLLGKDNKTNSLKSCKRTELKLKR